MTSKKEPQALLSAEKQFLYRDSFNRGFIQLPRMVAACLCLSAQARVVYSAISMFVYEQGKTAFPSIHRIAATCDMTAKSVIKYTHELEEKGFIRKVRRGNRLTNDYSITDLHEIKALYVSEMVWDVLVDIVNEEGEHSWERVDGAWKRLVLLAKEQNLSITQTPCTEEVREEIKKDIKCIMEGGTPDMVYIPRGNGNKTKLPESVPASSNKRTTYKDMHESEWKPDNFRFYFYEKYQELTGMRHANVDTVHRSILARILKQLDGDRAALKQYIDGFFAIGYDNVSLENFGTSGRFAEISLYLKEGKKPFYVEKSSTAKVRQESSAEQVYQGLNEEEFINRLRGAKK